MSGKAKFLLVYTIYLVVLHRGMRKWLKEEVERLNREFSEKAVDLELARVELEGLARQINEEM